MSASCHIAFVIRFDATETMHRHRHAQAKQFSDNRPCSRLNPTNLITRIQHALILIKLLLHTAHTHKPTQQIRTPSLIIRATRSRAAKRLLSHYRTSAFTVDIEIASRRAQHLLCIPYGFAILRKYGTSERVGGCIVYRFANFSEAADGVGLVVVDVDD